MTSTSCAQKIIPKQGIQCSNLEQNYNWSSHLSFLVLILALIYNILTTDKVFKKLCLEYLPNFIILVQVQQVQALLSSAGLISKGGTDSSR